MVGTPGPGHLWPLNPALDVFRFLIYALVSSITHFFESVEFTFLYARCKLCFNQLNKKQYLKTSFFPNKLVLTYYSRLHILHILYSIQESICSTYAQNLAKDIAWVFSFFSWNLATGGFLLIPQLLAFSSRFSAAGACSVSSKCATRISLRLGTQIV